MPEHTFTLSKLLTRRMLVLGLGASAFTTAPRAQPKGTLPTFAGKSVRLIVGYPPGGTADLLARLVANDLSKRFSQPVVVENRPGANGNIGADIVAKSAPDGHTLLMTAPGPLAVNASLYPSLPFDPAKAFAPIVRVAVAPLLLVVPSALPIHNLAELLAYAKAHPSTVSYGSQGNGSSGHLAMELLKSRTGMAAVHVPYKGSTPALNDLLAGHVTMMFDNISSSYPHVQSGALRALAVAETKRLGSMPDIPTISESGVRGFEATPWFGLVTTAGTPASVVNEIYRAVKDILDAPATQARFAQMGVERASESPDAFARLIQTETIRWRDVVLRSGARAE
ncbi:Bug family tripartite tricarboxylate transporter substrate binding protein [Variovorax sp. RT4R15]|uniref:Bug family tripartite tricarboxylate transporter substrate binding protein n=1 Tax=Variovorax sp. RT4R15 TaxID=3443737 RepID=UPI003F46477F